MSQWCPCRDVQREPGERTPRHCTHLIPDGHDRLLEPGRLIELQPLLGTILDAADAYDSDSLDMDPECQVHGEHPVSNPTCSCVGVLTSAVEFARRLELDIRLASKQTRDDRSRENIEAGARDRWSEPRLRVVSA